MYVCMYVYLTLLIVPGGYLHAAQFTCSYMLLRSQVQVYLLDLPHELLVRICRLSKHRHNLRCCCRLLRDQLDKFCTYLRILDRQNNAAGIVAMVQRMPFLAKLSVQTWMTSVPWREVLDAHESLRILGVETDDSSMMQTIGTSGAAAHLQQLAVYNTINSHPHFFNMLEGCSRLQKLYLGGCTRMRDVDWLQGLPQLQELYLGSCYMLQHCTLPLSCRLQLKKLEVYRWPLIKNLQLLHACDQLQQLDVSHCPRLADFGAVQACRRLQKLRVASCSALASVVIEDEMAQLDSLLIENCAALNDVNGFLKCAALTVLGITASQLKVLCKHMHCHRLSTVDLSGNRLLVDISCLRACGEILKLKLKGCINIKDLSPIRACTELTELDIGGCSYVDDLSPIQACAKLTKLALKNCHSVEDLSPIRACTELTELDLGGCTSLQDTSPIRACTKLTKLALGGCMYVKDLSFLRACTKMTSLDLGGCISINDLRPLKACTVLASLRLSNLISADTAFLNGKVGILIFD